MTKDKVLTIKLETEFKDLLIKEAYEKGLSLSAYVRMILTERNK